MQIQHRSQDQRLMGAKAVLEAIEPGRAVNFYVAPGAPMNRPLPETD
jgi:hypothetical protein